MPEINSVAGQLVGIPVGEVYTAGKGIKIDNVNKVVSVDDEWEDVSDQFTKVNTNLTWYNFVFYRNKATNLVMGTLGFRPSANIDWTSIFSTANDALKPKYSAQVPINTDTAGGGFGTIFQFATSGTSNFASLLNGKTYYGSFFYVCKGE